MVEKLEGKLFIPAHAEPMEDIKPLVKLNRDKSLEILNVLLEICKEPMHFELVLKKVFEHYNLTMDHAQYVLVGSTATTTGTAKWYSVTEMLRNGLVFL